MRNRDLLLKKIDRIEGRMKAVEISLTRPNTTIQEIKGYMNDIREQLGDIKTMVEREPVNYGNQR